MSSIVILLSILLLFYKCQCFFEGSLVLLYNCRELFIIRMLTMLGNCTGNANDLLAGTDKCEVFSMFFAFLCSTLAEFCHVFLMDILVANDSMVLVKLVMESPTLSTQCRVAVATNPFRSGSLT